MQDIAGSGATVTNKSDLVVIKKICYESSVNVFLELLEMLNRKDREYKNIGIKVNLCDYRMADSGATTDPRMLEALVIAIKTRYPGTGIFIWENDATSVEAHSLVDLLGFNSMFERQGVIFRSLSETGWEARNVPDPLIFKEILVPGALKEVDGWINFGKLKTNGITKTTGCLKNNFAFLKDKKKSVFHDKIDEVIVDINKVIRADLCIIDGHIGMEGSGPAFGVPKKCGIVIAGTDPVAVDACSARVMGFWPSAVRHIRMSAKAGIGCMKYHLSTDIRGFRYGDYKFRFSRIEYGIKRAMRKMTYIGAAG